MASASGWSKPIFTAVGVSMARASCQLLRKTQNPARTRVVAAELGRAGSCRHHGT
jgi:hypothetical protein